ncbi:Alpha/beta hydrolase family protein [Pedococcus dokdonensis]|uniref:Alpha/beta hydrolase family protein n=1 Tax=Pedococcus dokdonensis TaxID=443156 RepID=A0A1H0UJ69_9MICO|nr:prolyl oligopeptidase family serine peptidase [Pedococcus dokdonensis]SDP66143.1 Alpha/beta hydrolase family protein [Pedococcus dokdonensis]
MARDPIQVLDERAGPPTRTMSYGDDPTQVYDVRLPERVTRRLTVVVVHGGFWRPEYDRAHASRQAQAFADAGYPTGVLEYRRPGMPGGGWPGTPDDVAAGIRAIRRDPDLDHPWVLVGHSAGGQLVTWAAAQPWAHGLRGVVSLAGVVDLAHGEATGVGGDAIPTLLGGRPAEVPEAYAAADPARLAPAIPTVLVHARDDDVVPFELSERYAATHRAPNVRLTPVDGGGHYGLIDPEHPAFAKVLDAVDLLAS